jgi:hypothetical protein
MQMHDHASTGEQNENGILADVANLLKQAAGSGSSAKQAQTIINNIDGLLLAADGAWNTDRLARGTAWRMKASGVTDWKFGAAGRHISRHPRPLAHTVTRLKHWLSKKDLALQGGDCTRIAIEGWNRLLEKFRIALDKAAKGTALSVDEQNVIDVLKEAEARTSGRRVVNFPISFPFSFSGFPEDVARFIYTSALGPEIAANWLDYEAMFPNLVEEASRLHTKRRKNLVGPPARYARFRDDIAQAFVRFASRPLGDWIGWDFPLRPEQVGASS